MRLKLLILTISVGISIISCSSEENEPESEGKKSQTTAEVNKCDLCYHISRALVFNHSFKVFDEVGDFEKAAAYRDSLAPSMEWIKENSGLGVSDPSELEQESMESACASCLASYGVNLNSSEVHQQLLKLAEWTSKERRVQKPKDYLAHFEADQTRDSLYMANGRALSRESLMLHYDTLEAVTKSALDLIDLKINEAVDSLLDADNNNFKSRFILTHYATIHYEELEEKVGWDWYDGTQWKSIEKELTNMWAELTSD